ncbi:MAG: hypothetical protein ACLQKA_07575 [Bryobacteraceae bacterium]
MTRTRTTGICPVCRQVPQADDNGILRCACGEVRFENGVRGTDAEEQALAAAGFTRLPECGDNVYYVPDVGRIVRLYSTNEWSCDGFVPADCNTLEEYLAWRKQILDRRP